MRVIAGKWGKRHINAPAGRDTRPTTDRVKESLMSSIQSLHGFDDSCALDAFAGSGGLGIEALSRGARLVCFCEKAQSAFKVIQSNLFELKADKSEYVLFLGDINKAPLAKVNVLFDLVFLDPPYKMPPTDILSLIKQLDHNGLLAEDVLISYEHSSSQQPYDEILDSMDLEIVSNKKFGDTSIDFIKRS